MDGELIYEIGDNKLVYTDGDYDYPQISKVVEINDDSPEWVNYIKGEIFDAENRNEVENLIKTYEEVFGQKTIRTTNGGSIETYRGNEKIRSNDSRNRSESSGADSDSRKDVRFSIDG